jgi:hypothetical protein
MCGAANGSSASCAALEFGSSWSKTRATHRSCSNSGIGGTARSGLVTNTRRNKDKRREESVSTPTERKIHAGAGTVYVVRGGQLSIVESFADEKRIFFERDPATNSRGAFLRLYRGVNGLAEER